MIYNILGKSFRLGPESSFPYKIKNGTDLMNQNSRTFDDKWHESMQLPNTIY